MKELGKISKEDMFIFKIICTLLAPFSAAMACGMSNGTASYWFCLKETVKQIWETKVGEPK